MNTAETHPYMSRYIHSRIDSTLNLGLRTNMIPIKFNNKMKRKSQAQCGIRVKHFQSKQPVQQYHPQSSIASQQLSHTISHLLTSNTGSTTHLSESLSIELINQVQKLNQQVTFLTRQLRDKESKLQTLQLKYLKLEKEKHKQQGSTKRLLQQNIAQLQKKEEEIARKNIQIDRYRTQLSTYVLDIKNQNKDMMLQLIRELDTYREKEQRQKQTTLLYQHEKALRSIQQNSILNRHPEDNFHRQNEQVSMHKWRPQQPSFVTRNEQNYHPKSPPNHMSKSPSSRRIKIQRAQASSGNFKPLGQLMQLNSHHPQQDYNLLSPLTADIDKIQPRPNLSQRSRPLRAEEFLHM